MEWVISVLLETFTVRELGRGLLIALVLSPAKSLFPALLSHRKSVKSTLSTEVISAGGYVLLYLFARSWLALVCHAVPEPYLDEFFHIPQAQKYCEGRYLDWDDKITTPPGFV
ncbi:hypothetical protein P8C59_000681 [Phyllachora maydis]|uniref:Dol-P-Glc:Glc(2)Man(9)GlcNAc(2)-PP-Dol alpha-1,2-glucosyltransferase n=1 Tax=Phyllachora maydis TaxID=1825666 RepID=A0AAD9MAM7_9PEZI|nr:hypothetical protein P8C59_000681 [Phyllachora maydis]